MASVQRALSDAISENELLQLGLTNRLFNLSQLSKYLKSNIEVRLNKKINDSSLIMALSRLQRSLNPDKILPLMDNFRFQNIQVSSNLCIHTYVATKEKRLAITKLQNELQTKEKFISFTHSLKQITLFFGKSDLPIVRKHLTTKPLQSKDSVAVIGGVFDEQFSKHPGLFNAVFQLLYMQQINVLEVSSTYTELLIYVHENDMRLAFDTLYSKFMRR